MSDDSEGADARDSDVSDRVDDYDEMLEMLDAAIEEARRKIDSGRVYDAENEKVRIKWIRALAYTMNVRRQVTVDRDLEELAEKVEQIEKAQNGDGQDGVTA